MEWNKTFLWIWYTDKSTYKILSFYTQNYNTRKTNCLQLIHYTCIRFEVMCLNTLGEKSTEEWFIHLPRSRGDQLKSVILHKYREILTTIKRLLKRKSTSCTNNGVQLFWFQNSWNSDCSLVYVLTGLKWWIFISFVRDRTLRHTLSHSYVHIPIVRLCQIFDRNYKSCQKIQMRELI